MASQLTFVVYKDKADEWRWTLTHENSNKMADSGEGYKNKADCLSAIERIKSDAPTAPIKEA